MQSASVRGNPLAFTWRPSIFKRSDRSKHLSSIVIFRLYKKIEPQVFKPMVLKSHWFYLSIGQAPNRYIFLLIFYCHRCVTFYLQLQYTNFLLNNKIPVRYNSVAYWDYKMTSNKLRFLIVSNKYSLYIWLFQIIFELFRTFYNRYTCYLSSQLLFSLPHIVFYHSLSALSSIDNSHR